MSKRISEMGPEELERVRAQRRATAARYRERHPDRVKASAAAFTLANPGKKRAYARTYYARNAEACHVRAKAWQAANPGRMSDISRLACRKRRAATRGDANHVTARQWREQVEVFGNRCAYCLKRVARPTVEHVTPLSRGGAHDIDNVVPACARCNNVKQARGPLAMLEVV